MGGRWERDGREVVGRGRKMEGRWREGGGRLFNMHHNGFNNAFHQLVCWSDVVVTLEM